MPRFPSIDETGAFEAPEVQNHIKELVTGSTDGITVDTSVGTRVFVGDTKIYDEATQPAFMSYEPTAEDGVLFNAMRVQVLSLGDLKMVTIAGGYRHDEEMRYLFSVYPQHRPRSTVMTWSNGGALYQLLGDGRFRGTSTRTQPGWAYINISYITDRT